jgi:hypothetical protein
MTSQWSSQCLGQRTNFNKAGFEQEVSVTEEMRTMWNTRRASGHLKFKERRNLKAKSQQKFLSSHQPLSSQIFDLPSGRLKYVTP